LKKLSLSQIMSIAREETFLRNEWDGDKTEISKLIKVKSRRIMISVYTGKIICAVMLAKCRVNPNARRSRTTTPAVTKPKATPPVRTIEFRPEAMATDVSSAGAGTENQASKDDMKNDEANRSQEIRMVTMKTRSPSRPSSPVNQQPQPMALEDSNKPMVMEESTKPRTPEESIKANAATAAPPDSVPAGGCKRAKTAHKSKKAKKEDDENEPVYNFVPMTPFDYEIDYALTDKRLRGCGLGSLCTELFLNILFSKGAKKVFVGAEELEATDKGKSFYIPICDSPVVKYWHRMGFKQCGVEQFGHDELDHVPLLMTRAEYETRRQQSMFALINRILEIVAGEQIQSRLPKYSTPRTSKIRINTPWLGDFWVDCTKV